MPRGPEPWGGVQQVALVIADIVLDDDRPAPPGGAVASAAAPAPDFVTGVCGECHAVTSATVSLDPQAPGFADIAGHCRNCAHPNRKCTGR